MDSINVACVGVGYWGKNLVRNFYGLPGCDLKVCCDLSDDNLRNVTANYPGVAVTGSFEEVLSDPSIDAVVIASPAAYHHQMVRQALIAGKHVYVE